MAHRDSQPLSPFGEAAIALDQELQRFHRLTEAGARIGLSSRRNVEKAARSVDEADACQRRLGELMGQFVAALSTAREDNAACARGLDERRAEVHKRMGEMGQLMERFARLGNVAAEISSFVRDVGARTRDVGGNAETVAALAEVEGRMGTVVDEARDLARSAQEASLPDLAEEVETLRQQLLGARNKTALLRQRLSTT